MLVLLPPSEGKTPPMRGPVLNLDVLCCPRLNPTRRDVLAALRSLCADPDQATRVLGLGPKQRVDINRNAALDEQPCAPAIEVYTGVLFSALNYPNLTDTAQRWVDAHALIASALFGVVRPTDPIPAYRLSAAARLPGLPTPKSTWQVPLLAAIDELAGDGPVLDLRSGAYRAHAKPRNSDPAAQRWLTVRVVTEHNGVRKVVSHHNKASKGMLIADLARAGSEPDSADELTAAIADAGWRVWPADPGTIDVLTR